MMKKTKEFIEMSDGAYIFSEHYCADQEDCDPGAEKTAVVMIPGFCCTTEFFRNNAGVVAQSYETVVYDPRGQGNSSKGLQGHTVARNAVDLREILAYYDIHNAVIIAWSMAGQFIMDYVRQFGTECLKAVVLADCPLHALGNELWNAHGLSGGNMDHFNAHLHKSYNDWDGYCRDFAVKIWNEVDPSLIGWAADEFVKTPPWIAFAIYSDMVYRNGFPYLAKADIPMLFTGANSKVTSNGINLASKWYPESRDPRLVTRSCTFSKGGHVFFYAESEKFNSELLKFIRDIS